MSSLFLEMLLFTEADARLSPLGLFPLLNHFVSKLVTALSNPCVTSFIQQFSDILSKTVSTTEAFSEENVKLCFER